MKASLSASPFARSHLDVLDKGFVEDAREVITRLANPEPLDETTKIRMRMMTRELQDNFAELAASGAYPDFLRAAAGPVRELSRAILDTEDLDSPAGRDSAALGFLTVVQTLEADAEGAELWQQDDAGELATWVLEHLQIKVDRLAAWLRVGERTIQRWQEGGTPSDPDRLARLQALVRLSARLRFLYPPRGIVQFLERPVGAWGKQRAVDILDDEERIAEAEKLIASIRG